MSGVLTDTRAGHEFDLVSLGEVLLRLDPGEGRIRDARTFEAHVGGGEFNVAFAVSNCFELRTGVVTALADNEVGALMSSLIRQGGVDTSLIQRRDDGGTGIGARNGLNFTERGFGVRPAYGVSDRAFSAAARLAPGEVDWDDLFRRRGVRWFHTGGVFTALSPSSAALTLEAVRAAKSHGVTVSYDVNFRPSLWRALADPADHAATTREIFRYVDVLISNEPEYLLSVGETVVDASDAQAERFLRMVERARKDFPNIALMAATQRTMRSASVNDWGAIAWSDRTGVVHSSVRERLDILDRVGAGDSFVAGLAYGLLTGAELSWALELGVAHGALVMTTPGDTSSARRTEVEALAAGSGIRAVR
ncbi:sugar kinase [Agrococcus sp. KRD186]|uniref:sugar kinase n=1 Tax=Agrococcus sp. KRD186 TaxID=2729730 RepID=UPI0019D2782A|nr:sugar kinase [Agrococcus sp. KRD186]